MITRDRKKEMKLVESKYVIARSQHRIAIHKTFHSGQCPCRLARARVGHPRITARSFGVSRRVLAASAALASGLDGLLERGAAANWREAAAPAAPASGVDGLLAV